MDKKLSLTDYIFTLAFIFMLVAAVGAFFFGMKIGSEKTAEKYETALAAKSPPSQDFGAYHQQYLVSFYHTIYLPYREFQKKWFEHMETIERGSKSVEPAPLFKQLGKLADETFDKISVSSMPDASPLLQVAERNYLKSLKLFHEASVQFQDMTKQLSGDKLLQAIRESAYFQEAVAFSLSAQKDYARSIVAWHESVEPVKGMERIDKEKLKFDQWSELPFNSKNYVISRILEEQKLFVPYFAHDLTLRVDEMIMEGQADLMKLADVDQVVQTLVGTKAVREGDFLRSRDKYYERDTMPQLPFFYE